MMVRRWASRKPARSSARRSAAGRRTIAANVFRAGVAVVCAFSVLALGAGWWQVAEAQRLSTAADNPAVIAVARRAMRGPIVDRTGAWLARSVRDDNGEALREYRDSALSHVIGYASRVYGTAGLERTYNAQLLGLAGVDPVGGPDGQVRCEPSEDPLGLQLSLDLRLQRAAVKALGSDKGAVVMLDPATGEVLALASTPVYDAGAIADPATARRTFNKAPERRAAAPAAPGNAGAVRAGFRVQDRDRAAALDSNAVEPVDHVPGAARGRGGWAGRERVPDPRRPPPPDRRRRRSTSPGRRRSSCNIWYALAGLETGGERLVEAAAEMGFGGADPFDLPTAHQPGHRRRRQRPRRLRGRHGAGVGGVRPGRDVRDAAPDGARRLDRGQRRRADEAAPRDGAHRRRSGRPDRRLVGVAPRPCRGRCPGHPGGDAAGGRGRATAGSSRGAPQSHGVPTAGKSGTAELGGKGEPHSWFIGFAPVENPTVAIAVLVEQGGRGGERAAPLAGALMERYFDLYGKP